MAKSPKDDGDWTSLPVLTEIVGDVPPEVPVLTEEALNLRIARNGDAPELSAEEIAALLVPRLEQLLRARLSAQFEALWQETWQQARTQLPDLIRSQLAAQRDTSGSAGGKMPGLDIIARQSAAPAGKKTAAGKAGTAKANSKTK